MGRLVGVAAGGSGGIHGGSSSQYRRRRRRRRTAADVLLLLGLVLAVAYAVVVCVPSRWNMDNVGRWPTGERETAPPRRRGDDADSLRDFLADFQESGRVRRRRLPLQQQTQQSQQQKHTQFQQQHPPSPNDPNSLSARSSRVKQQQQREQQQRIPDNGNTTFSACLLVMDDNPRLPEWIAYHYHVLPLRYLIVAVDPRSKESPTLILDMWRDLKDNNNDPMIIEEWNDTHFLRPDLASNVIPDDAPLQVKRDRHRTRQKNFYRACLDRMRHVNRTWTLLIDTDEFLVYNRRGGVGNGTSNNNNNNNNNEDDETYRLWEERQTRIHAERDHGYPKGKVRIPLSRPPPSVYEKGGMIGYLTREKLAGHPFFQSPCVSCPRLQFGAKESPFTVRAKDVPSSLLVGGGDENDNKNDNDKDYYDKNNKNNKTDVTLRLDTIRFRHHAERQDFVRNGLSKVIIDVSRLPLNGPVPRIETLHRPIKTICPPPWRDEWEAGLRINHYLGSWEQYSHRDDSRRGGERSLEGWAFKAGLLGSGAVAAGGDSSNNNNNNNNNNNIANNDANNDNNNNAGDETDDNIRPWLHGFVDAVGGPDNAKKLLKDAGLPPGDGSSSNNNKNWTIMFLDEILSANETKGNDMRVAFDNFVRDFHLVRNRSLEGIV